MPRATVSHLVRIGDSAERHSPPKSLYRCKACGNEKEIYDHNVRSLATVSCGCQKLANIRTHGRTRTKEYGVWHGVVQRCCDPSCDGYERYGARGVTICVRWRESFEDFMADMGERPTPRHQIDRKDNNGGYWCGKAECPECGPAGRDSNCRWVTPKENCRNRGTTRLFTHGDRTQTLTEWAKEFNTNRRTLGRFIDEYGFEAAVTHQFAKRRRNV